MAVHTHTYVGRNPHEIWAVDCGLTVRFRFSLDVTMVLARNADLCLVFFLPVVPLELEPTSSPRRVSFAGPSPSESFSATDPRISFWNSLLAVCCLRYRLQWTTHAYHRHKQMHHCKRPPQPPLLRPKLKDAAGIGMHGVVTKKLQTQSPNNTAGNEICVGADAVIEGPGRPMSYQ